MRTRAAAARVGVNLDADIILYNGKRKGWNDWGGWICEGIRLIDGTEVNHASLYFQKTDEVGEALANGLHKKSLTKRDFSQSIAGNNYVIVKRLKELGLRNGTSI